MPAIVTTRVVDAAGLDALRTPRADVVSERVESPDRYGAASGPFRAYERTLTAAPRPDGDIEVTERIEFAMAPYSWRFLFAPLYRRALARRSHIPWWAPPDRLDAEAATALGLLCLVALPLGYLGTLVSQTMTFAADEFGSSESAQGDTLAAVRFGVLLAIALTTLADRRGRRRLLRISALIAIAATSLGALVPTLPMLGATQVVARGATTALAIVIAILAAEELPAGSRAYGVSLLSMAGALGAGMCLWVLPLADVGERWWRALYALPLLAIPVVLWAHHRLPESRRFRIAHTEATIATHGRRFWLLASASLMLALFTTPASLFQNEYLREDRGYSAAGITLFVILTNTPGAIGVVAGGRLAEHGRRAVAAVAIVGGTAATVVMFNVSGSAMWFASAVGAVVGAAAVPALGVYGPELFPTSLRGRANGAITLLGVLGSSIGLVIVGRLAESYDQFGPALTIMAAGPLLMALLVLLAFPETAHRELEDINPEDVTIAPESEPGAPGTPTSAVYDR
jgi:MFS family permease